MVLLDAYPTEYHDQFFRIQNKLFKESFVKNSLNFIVIIPSDQYILIRKCQCSKINVSKLMSICNETNWKICK